MNEKEKEQLKVKYEKWCYERAISSDIFDFNAEIDGSLSFNKNSDEAWQEIENKLNLMGINKDYQIKQRIKNEISEEKDANAFLEKTINESKIYVILGKRGCLPVGTIIKTPMGKVKIEDLKGEVLSYNLKKRKIEAKKANLFNSGLKQIVKIYTNKGKIECSTEHKWVVIRDKNIKIIRAKDLNTTDLLLLVK